MGMRQAKASKEDIQALVDFFNDLDEALEGYGRGPTDERLAAIIGRHWNTVSCSWRRVVFGCEMLIENCCDPELTYLEWRKDVAEFLASQATTNLTPGAP